MTIRQPTCSYTLLLFVALVVVLSSTCCRAWTSMTPLPQQRRRHETRLYRDANTVSRHDGHETQQSSRCLERRTALTSIMGALTTAAIAAATTTAAALADETTSQTKLLQLPSGLKFIDLKEGTGPTPEYGQLCSIAYKGYIKLPASKDNANPHPQLFGQSPAYLLKHGNGRTIAGLDQGLHTLRVGGTRRLIIPAKLGYTQTGLGPLPPSPWDRFRLNNLLDDMVKYQGGNLVFEVTLLSAIDDEADQGYYSDGSLSPEDFETLKLNIQRKAQDAKSSNQV